MSATLKHGSLGELKGNALDGAAEFLGLKYGTLKNRLAPAEIINNYGSEPTNATKYGPPPVSPVGAVNSEFAFIQQVLPIPDVPTHSDLEGLSLNITVPVGKDGKIDVHKKLPVYAFFHGGAWAVGSSWYPSLNPAAIVKLSTELGKPIIGVTVNYRLGVAGFLTSEELRKAGYKANNGYHDQQTAMRWIKKHISGFGGDPNEVTAVGESAGAASVTMMLCSQEPLMKRCLSTGGAVLVMPPLPLAVAESSYQGVSKALGLSDKTPEERINALLSMPQDDLWQKVPMTIPVLPVIDGEIVPSSPSFAAISSKANTEFTMPGRKWCEALMMGDSQLDANILTFIGLDQRKAGIAKSFIISVNNTLSSQPEAAKSLFEAYNLSPTTDDDEALMSILRFASEISFYAPSRAFGQGWPGKFYLYHFNEGNPWPGRFQGEAGHILDIAYLFQNFNERLDDSQKAVARAYGEDFIKFVNGEDPYPVAGEKMGARVYGPSSKGVTTKFVADAEPSEIGRPERVLMLGDLVGFDTLLACFANFMQGR